MSLILNYESAVINTTAKEASLTIAPWPLATAQIMNISRVSGDSMDHRSLSKRLNPENEPFFISAILLLRVRVITWLGSMSPDRT